MKSFWADVEGTLDKGWVEQCGVPSDTYSVALCDYGEQYIDVAEAILEADDCGLLIIDSLAALVPEAELEESASQQFMGNQSKMITKCVKKLRSRLNREMKRGHPCAVIFTNQMRKQIGVMFGDPETQPGGHAARHEFSLVLRCVRRSLGKKKEDEKEAAGPAVGEGEGSVDKYIDGERKKDRASRHSFTIKKEKVLTLAGTGEFLLVKEDIPALGLRKGMVDDFNALFNYARANEVVTKVGSEYRFLNLKSKNAEDIKKLWRLRPQEYLRADIEIVKRAKQRLALKKEGKDS
jgi:recombination protein RecA